MTRGQWLWMKASVALVAAAARGMRPADADPPQALPEQRLAKNPVRR